MFAAARHFEVVHVLTFLHARHKVGSVLARGIGILAWSFLTAAPAGVRNVVYVGRPEALKPARPTLFMTRASVDMADPMRWYRVLLKVAPVWITCGKEAALGVGPPKLLPGL